MRQLEPFSYYLQHASAIQGFGGAESAPDPRYCFHTHYEEFQPGRAVFRLTLAGAQCSQGELTLRVHGYKPGPDSDITLVAGTRRLLANEEQGAAAIELAVSFVAVKGAQYALYGFFSEPSDLRADSVLVTIEELDPTRVDAQEAAAGRSRFSNLAMVLPGRLYSDEAPSLERPVSQDCTRGQLTNKKAGRASEAQLEQWRAEFALAALERYGWLDANAHGVVRGTVARPLKDILTSRDCQLDALDAGQDFLISRALDQPAGQQLRYRVLQEDLSRLLRGGLAIFYLRYFADEAPANGQFACRNEIGQWALRLIGAGHDVAQLAFAPLAERTVDEDGKTPFALIVRAGGCD